AFLYRLLVQQDGIFHPACCTVGLRQVGHGNELWPVFTAVLGFEFLQGLLQHWDGLVRLVRFRVGVSQVGHVSDGDAVRGAEQDRTRGLVVPRSRRPEEECSLCMSEASAKKMFKDKGDWCKLHDRAQSQCFKCDPSLYEKVFVPKHVAKMGKTPERPPEAEFV